MTKFNEDDKVRVDACRVPWDEVAIGTVETATYNPGLECSMYIVRLESGDLVKCLEEDLEAVEENVEESTEKTQKTVTLTREEFVKAVCEACRPNNLKKLPGLDTADAMFIIDMSLTGIIIGKGIELVLFGEKADND